MKFKIIILILSIAIIAQSCNQHKAEDFAGTYIGNIRGKKISMFLKTGDNQTVTGTIFDKANNFSVSGSVKHDKFLGQAKDDMVSGLFDVEGYFDKDTLIFMMSMVKPQKSPPLPVKFQKVFITSSNGATPDKNTVMTDTGKNSAPVSTSSSANDRHDAALIGLWEVKDYTKGKVSPIISGNKYVFFNVNGSLSYLDGELKPIKDKVWFTDGGQLFFVSTNSGESNENMGKYTMEGNSMILNGQGGAIVVLLKK